MRHVGLRTRGPTAYINIAICMAESREMITDERGVPCLRLSLFNRIRRHRESF